MAALRKELIVHRDPEILGGTPVFAGTRVPARILFEHLEAGDSLEVFLQQFPRSILAKEVNSARMIGVAFAGERNQRAGINENAPHWAAIWLSGSAHDALPHRSGRP